MSRTYRQGNVLLQRVIKLPPNARKWIPEDEARIVLAYSEITGYAHAVSTAFAQLYLGEFYGERFLVTSSGARLVNEQHAPVELPPGIYKVLEPNESMPALPSNCPALSAEESGQHWRPNF